MNKYIRGTAEVETFRDKGDDKILRWFGHIQWKHSGYTEQMMLNIELPDRRKEEDHPRRFVDVMKQDKQRVSVTEEDTRT